ncbi:MAG: SLBB domain-containing protein, partial [Gemmatimonadetes bacterium]|nr:SLBB domain-containing protein [Gemmatimonadota bacterium]
MDRNQCSGWTGARKEYDLVRIYSRDRFRESRTVSIGGIVNRPDSYGFWNGMTLRDLVMLSGGLRDGAYLDSAEVARLPADRSGGRLAVTLKVPLDSTYLLERDSTTYPRLPGLPSRARGAPEVTLEPFDHVTILRQPGFELQRTVTIAGEVRFPGTYALTRKDERVSDLVRRAGGLLPTAYAD